jgi:hypothetical protein
MLQRNSAMLGTRTLRDRSTSRGPDSQRQSRTEPKVKQESKEGMAGSTWVEPALAQKPSYRDHKGVSYYGVSEHMQPLGEAPSARVKTRVKTEGPRKSVLGRSAAGGGLDAQETPEGTPAPQTASQAQAAPSPQPRIVVDDEDDKDYAPKPTARRKERAAKPRTAKQRVEAPSRSTPKIQPPHPSSFNAKKTKAIVEEAKDRAWAAGKPDLADAVNEIYLQALQNGALMVLMQAILSQSATPDQSAQFQQHVKTAKKKLKERKLAQNSVERDQPDTTNGSTSLPLRSPSKFTSGELDSTSAIPSTEPSDTLKPKTSSLSVKSPSKNSNRRQSATMSKSPSKRRDGTPGSDSSLTDLTSNPDEDMDLDDVEGGDATGPPQTIIKGKDFAAERGSLAAPNRNLKRSSADAELQAVEDERERVLAAKKQKLTEGVQRDDSFEESNVREEADSRTARLRTRQGGNVTLSVPSLASLNTSGGRRGTRAASSDLDSPLSTPVTASSRQSTPHIPKGPAKLFGKKAKTKQS